MHSTAQRDTSTLHLHPRSLSSKVVSQYSSLLSPMAADAVYKVLDASKPNTCGLQLA